MIEPVELSAAIAEPANFPKSHMGMELGTVVGQVFIFDLRNADTGVNVGNALVL